ncbi:MAG: VanZ family protein [Candidatus Omnitrophica bacterium]|nr:VanZ family protein [Candidatus Omnitrophota bacterium]
MRKWLFLWAPVAAYIAFIFWLSSAPRPIPGIRQFPWLDKPLHTLEYAPLGALLSRALRHSLPSKGWRIVQALALIGAVFVGSADEFYQRFVPLRFSSIWDTVADCAGALFGQAFYQRRSQRTP